MNALIDISPPLSADTPVFPGDSPFHSVWRWRMQDGAPVNVSTITLSVHAGAHADAPLHYDRTGAPIDAVPLDRFVGPCRVLDMRGAGTFVRAEALARSLGEAALPPRILLRTHAVSPVAWDPSFTALHPAAIELLAARGVVLVGVDTASVDPADSKTLPAHDAARRCGLTILENLVLSHVAAGNYELIALPLRLAGLDAAPVRAVLRTTAHEQ
jgi:arylformamidase